MGCATSSGAAPLGGAPKSRVVPAAPSWIAAVLGPAAVGRAPAGQAASQRFHETYELERKLGSGSFASVHAARRRRTEGAGGAQPALAVKVVGLFEDRSMAGEVSSRRCQSVLREVEMLEKVRGEEHILEVHGFFLEDGLAYIVMERCDSTLVKAMEALPQLTESTLKRFFREMLQGLAALHDAGIIHRDVKPDNFLCFGPRATVKLCDFGLATTFFGQGTVGICGTPPYMSPEMLRHLYYDGRTDVWSLGVIVYALLLGEFPYMPTEGTSASVKAAIAGGKRLPTFQPRSKLQALGLPAPSPAASAFLRAALSRRPRDRPAARAALASDFLIDRPAASPEAALWFAFRSARALGVFDVPSAGSATAGRYDKLERRLAELQAQHRRQAGTLLTSRAGAGARPSAQKAGLHADVESAIGRPRRLKPSALSLEDLGDGSVAESVGSTRASCSVFPSPAFSDASTAVPPSPASAGLDDARATGLRCSHAKSA